MIDEIKPMAWLIVHDWGSRNGTITFTTNNPDDTEAYLAFPEHYTITPLIPASAIEALQARVKDQKENIDNMRLQITELSSALESIRIYSTSEAARQVAQEALNVSGVFSTHTYTGENKPETFELIGSYIGTGVNGEFPAPILPGGVTFIKEKK